MDSMRAHRANRRSPKRVTAALRPCRRWVSVRGTLAMTCACLSASCGRGGATDRKETPRAEAVKPSDSSAAPRAGTAGTADSTVLTIAALPEAAKAVLRASAPAFVPFDPSKYPPDIVAAAHQSADEGLVVIRGDLQSVGRQDFAVAGMEGDSLRVLALFQQQDSTYRLVDVYSVRPPPFAKTTPPGVPAVFLERAPCEFSCKSKSAFTIVLRFVGDRTSDRPTHFAWVERLKQFVTDEPID